LAGGKLGARFLLAKNPEPGACATASRQLRQPLQRGPRTAAMGDERAEGAGADIVGADQPQAVDPLGLGQGCRAVDGVHAGFSFVAPA